MPASSSGRLARVPLRRTTSTRSDVPYRNWVTMRVHSPTSVGATRRPISAFTSVDLPAFNRPAMATRSGSPRRRRTSYTWDWAAPPSRWPTSAQRSATRELSGPGAIRAQWSVSVVSVVSVGGVRAGTAGERVGVAVAVVDSIGRAVVVAVAHHGIGTAVLVGVDRGQVGAAVEVRVGDQVV